MLTAICTHNNRARGGIYYIAMPGTTLSLLALTALSLASAAGKSPKRYAKLHAGHPETIMCLHARRLSSQSRLLLQQLGRQPARHRQVHRGRHTGEGLHPRYIRVHRRRQHHVDPERSRSPSMIPV